MWGEYTPAAMRRRLRAKRGSVTSLFYKGTTVILLRMQMDLENGVYMYHEKHPFTLPTTYHTHAQMDIALEVISNFKDQILKVEDYNCQSIWDRYKPYVRPTVSYFEPIYHS
ncbi:hypothetical protein PS15m_002844 [Mucor circinelloides]